MTHTLTVDIPRDYWLTMNRTVTNHGYRRRIIGALHDITVATAVRQGLKANDGPVELTWTIHYPKGVGPVADAVNAAPTTKALLDALVPRWLPRDDSRCVRGETFRRGPNLDVAGGHRVALEFRPVGEA